MRSSSQDEVDHEENPTAKTKTFLSKLKHELMQIVEYLREICHALVPLINYIAHYYKIVREAMKIRPEDPIVSGSLPSKLSPEEKVEETVNMLSDVLDSLKRPSPEPNCTRDKDEKEREEPDLVALLEQEYQQVLEDIEVHTPTFKLQKFKPTILKAMNRDDDNLNEASQVQRPGSSSSENELIEPDATRQGDWEAQIIGSYDDNEQDDEASVEERFQKRLAEQNRLYQEKLEKLRQSRKQ